MSDLAVFEQRAALTTEQMQALDEQMRLMENELGAVYAAAQQRGDEAAQELIASAWQRSQQLAERERELIAQQASLLKAAQTIEQERRQLVQDMRSWNWRNPEVGHLIDNIQADAHDTIWSGIVELIMESTDLVYEGAAELSDLLFSAEDYEIYERYTTDQLRHFQQTIQNLMATIASMPYAEDEVDDID